MQGNNTDKTINRLSFSAAVLAGGESKRMGKNKAFLKLGGRRIIDLIVEELQTLFAEVIVVTDSPSEMASLTVRLVEDIFTGGKKNSLRGVHAALHTALYPSCFIMACDSPFLSLPLIEHMASFAREYDLVAPWLDGYYQPLFSFYNKTSLPVITEALEQKFYRIYALFDYLHVKKISKSAVRSYDPRQLSFFNINTREDYQHAKTLFPCS